jgi:hypothetical protein
LQLKISLIALLLYDVAVIVLKNCSYCFIAFIDFIAFIAPSAFIAVIP